MISSFKPGSLQRSNRAVSGWSGLGTTALSARIEETFKRLSSVPAPSAASSAVPNAIDQDSPATLSSAPIPQPRKILTPKGSARGSSTFVIPFLQFPAEIRLEIYSYFLWVPPEKLAQRCDRKRQDNRSVLRLARKNLRRLCHQISEEWDPLFFSTTTITVRNLLPDWDSLLISSTRPNSPLMNFGELWHKGLETISTPPQTRPLGSGLFRTDFLERQPPYKLNRIRKLQYLITGSSLERMDLTDLALLAAMIHGTKEDLLKSLEEVSICWRPLRVVRGFFKGSEIWAECSGTTDTWDKVKALFQPEDGFGCFQNWKMIRRMCIYKAFDVYPWFMFVHGSKVHELQLVFRKSQPPSAARHTEWVELPGI
ncbi:hypothetical protein AYL99_00421 [Fonsecaea erecta]|uniref:F-box domain-containing protein n=1 Tax=Fonsecaea erecta TaxID=1367422 RepID=A0A178ZXA8_9EURO|nr:hypothetical protein AYL99_00421 [Fonsecaea erecta]OAP64449.1 hypothetical protein AYL99_00421 [Fonsecaea erecta]